RRAGDLSGEHPAAIDHHREARGIAEKHPRKSAPTPDPRQALVHYPAPLQGPLEAHQTGGGAAERKRGSRTRAETAAAAGEIREREVREAEVREANDQVPAAERPRAIHEAPAPLFANEDAGGYRTRWSAIQTGFVDEPRKAVEEADTLVAEVMKQLAEVFAQE